jgi:serine phosphatase RsbU (regulator of sigma subunit)
MDALRELTALVESLGRAKSFSEVADRLTTWARQFTGCQAAMLRLWEGAGTEAWLASCSAEGHSPAFSRDEAVVGHDDCLCGRVASGAVDSSLPFFTQGGSFCWGRFGSLERDFASEELGPIRGRCLKESYESVAIFPLCMDDRIIGSLHLADPRPDQFEGVVDVVEAVCRMAGPLLLSHLDRDREHAVLETIQAALMPAEPPTVEGLEIGVSFGSATELARLGGDFYDVVDLGEAGVLVLAGDVAGKGVEAAGVAARARYVIVAQAGLDPDPGVFMERANQALVRSLPRGRFVTVAACLVDPAAGTVTTCLAGHPAPLRITGRATGVAGEAERRQTDLVESQAPHNPPLGVFADQRFRTTKEDLGPGDVLLVYTDGVTDSRRGQEVFGLAGIAAVASQQGSTGPREIAEAVYRSAVAFHDPAFPDDDRLVIAVRLRNAVARTLRGSH